MIHIDLVLNLKSFPEMSSVSLFDEDNRALCRDCLGCSKDSSAKENGHNKVLKMLLAAGMK